MTDILLSEAVDVVRRNIDEASADAAAMFWETTDTTALNSTIKGMLAQAINDVCAIAPAYMMQGITKDHEDITYSDDTPTADGVVEFAIDGRVARIVALKAYLSDIVLTGSVDESSPEGRMQLNKYTRGTYDDPCLVRMQVSNRRDDPGASVKTFSTYRYYTLKENGIYDDGYIEYLSYYPIAEQSDDCAIWDSSKESFQVPDLLKETILKHITGLVLTIYGETDKARFYLQNISNTQE